MRGMKSCGTAQDPNHSGERKRGESTWRIERKSGVGACGSDGLEARDGERLRLPCTRVVPCDLRALWAILILRLVVLDSSDSEECDELAENRRFTRSLHLPPPFSTVSGPSPCPPRRSATED